MGRLIHFFVLGILVALSTVHASEKSLEEQAQPGFLAGMQRTLANRGISGVGLSQAVVEQAGSITTRTLQVPHKDLAGPSKPQSEKVEAKVPQNVQDNHATPAGSLAIDHLVAVLSCESLGGKGSLDSECELKDPVVLSDSSEIHGAGNLTLLEGAAVNCSYLDCNLSISLGGNLDLLSDATIVGGEIHVEAENVSVGKGASISARALGGTPPPQTSGSPTTTDGSGGGHGGRVRRHGHLL
jgi:hypothetical protein